MCYLPKVTFYVYFGFFFLGYLWIFGLLFFRTVNNSNDRNKLPSDFMAPHQPPGDQPKENSGAKEVNSAELRSPIIFDLTEVDTTEVDETRCVLASRKPQFRVCTHDPAKDTGVSATLHLRKEWESDVSDAIVAEMKKFSPSNSIFIDIGANIGWFSLLVAASGYSVVAVEPFRDNLVRLATSAFLNNCTRQITAIQNAVSDRRENLTFVDKADNIGGRFSLRSDADRFKFQNFKKLSVRAIELDDLLTVVGQSAQNVVLKLDIQGDECRALRSSHRLFSTYKVSSVFMEWEETRKLEDRRCVIDMLNLFRSGDSPFQPFSLAGTKIDNLDSTDFSLPENIVWRRQKD